MSSLQDFFTTNWSAMTSMDWVGLTMVLILTLLMIGLYVWVFRPANRDGFEQYRDFVNEIDENEMREVGHGQER
ncbi:MAG: CcoQ/FixQ family Cbb3-type cytochrome c oxidase assembly chaperone [Mariprofundales bacterium]